MRGTHLPWRGKTAASHSAGETSAAFYDMDGTLVRTNLVHSYLYLTRNEVTVSRSILKTLEGLAKLPAFLVADRFSRAFFNEMLYAGYEGMYEDRLLELAEEHFDEVLRPNIYPGIYELVENARKVGLRQVIVSGSLDVFVAPLARHLGMDDFVSNRLELKDGVATGKLVKPIVAGAVKARLIQEYAQAFDIDLLRSYAYSDSFSDYSMLAVVGRPAAVNPDSRLRRAAQELEWPVIDVR
ncbi:MAG: HAD-IB family hydrolase [Myxococcales bacterium]|nr:HAD-IB family hydrolase [Myxococcales bacterium]